MRVWIAVLSHLLLLLAFSNGFPWFNDKVLSSRDVRLIKKHLPVRLDGGTHPHSGRVQVYYINRIRRGRLALGQWGGVCDTGWNKQNADVVCRHLGYKDGAVLFTKGIFYGPQRTQYSGRTQRIWLDKVYCDGREDKLYKCHYPKVGRAQCNDARLAGVMCNPGLHVLIKRPTLDPVYKNFDFTSYRIKLKSDQRGEIVSEGLLGVQDPWGRWGAVCSDNWGTRDAMVACGELGFPNANMSGVIKATSNAEWKHTYFLTNMQCDGTEAWLLSCKSPGFGHHTCKSGPVTLKCSTKKPQDQRVRLKAGVHAAEGRVEVRIPGTKEWATLCDKDINIQTANVLCRSMGYGTAKEYTLGTVFARGMDYQKIFTYLKCKGDEWYAENCIKRRVVQKDYKCKHYNDAGLRCNVPAVKHKLFKVRLRGGGRYIRGRTEVNINGTWGMVCGDTWSMKNAMVVCRQLGLGYALRHYSLDYFQTSGDTLLSGVTCLGNEARLDQCLYHDFNNVKCSSNTSVAGAWCTKELPDLAWDVVELQQTLSMKMMIVAALSCAYEENCLTSTAADYFQGGSLQYLLHNHERKLLRFSAKVHNVGTADYTPRLQQSEWIWHACHEHYHSDEEFALYDIIDPTTHLKVAEGHKASYCLEDTNCDDGVEKIYNCTGRGAQGISVNCHDNYDYSLDCQWIDLTDVSYPDGKEYLARIIANPQMKVGESDYSNNVALCKITLGQRSLRARACHVEVCESGARSYHGNANYACCVFPFIYLNKKYDTCIVSDISQRYWCATSRDYDRDKLWGYC